MSIVLSNTHNVGLEDCLHLARMVHDYGLPNFLSALAEKGVREMRLGEADTAIITAKILTLAAESNWLVHMAAFRNEVVGRVMPPMDEAIGPVEPVTP